MTRSKIIAGVKKERKVVAETGSTRSSRDGKGRFDLIPPCALLRLARRYEGGAACHGDRNWEQGMSAGRCVDSAMRHLNQWVNCERDEDHLGAAMWNIAALMFLEEKMPQHLDMPGMCGKQPKPRHRAK